MALMLLLAACGKQPAGKTASKGKAGFPAILNETNINPDEVLTIRRKGEQVTIRWDEDFSTCKGIRIIRNNTGMAKNRQTVANIPASSKEYVDSVPDTGVYWYWIAVTVPGEGGKLKYIGPSKAPKDTGNSGKYTAVSNNGQLTAQRTESAVVVAWDLPDAKYKSVSIKRNNNPQFSRPRNPRTNVLTTKEWRGDMTDKLPDPNADYWYWLEANREDGTVISLGPVKAEFAGGETSSGTPLPPAKGGEGRTGNGKGKGKGKGKDIFK